MCTCERIRIIEKNALKRIRKNKDTKKLACYIDNAQMALARLEQFQEKYKYGQKIEELHGCYYEKTTEKLENSLKKEPRLIYNFYTDYSRNEVDEVYSLLSEEVKN